MKQHTISINGRDYPLEFAYCLTFTDEFYSSFDALLEHWAPTYGSKEKVRKQARFEAVAVAKGITVLAKGIKRPLTNAEKEKLLTTAENCEDAFWTLE